MTWMYNYVGIDLETTGVSVEDDQIVTCAIVSEHDGDGQVVTNLLLKPDRPISDSAAAVHGITNDYASQNGMDRAEAITTIHKVITEALSRGCATIAYNAPFDLTILDREFRRFDLPPIDFTAFPVIDPLVLARFLFPKKRMKLVDLAQAFAIEFDAHDALSDITTTIEIAKRLGDREINHRELKSWPLRDLHFFQMGVAGFFAVDLRAYFLSRGQTGRAGTVSSDWPMIAPPGQGKLC